MGCVRGVSIPDQDLWTRRRTRWDDEGRNKNRRRGEKRKEKRREETKESQMSGVFRRRRKGAPVIASTSALQLCPSLVNHAPRNKDYAVSCRFLRWSGLVWAGQIELSRRPRRAEVSDLGLGVTQCLGEMDMYGTSHRAMPVEQIAWGSLQGNWPNAWR